MKFISLCSGIEAASHAVEPLGWTPVVFSEIDETCSLFLKKKYPGVRNVGDMTQVAWHRFKAKVTIGGTPCPSFSKMGAWRRDIIADADPRGRLAYQFLHTADETDSEWFIWENVSNVLAADDGRFFEAWCKEASNLGYVLGWRVLCTHEDFGLPTLRKRLFVVGHRGPLDHVERVLFRPGDNCGRSLSIGAQDRTSRYANSDLAEGSVVAFDAASIKPVGRTRALPTLLRGHATRYGLVIGAGSRGPRKSGDLRPLTPREAEQAMGFSGGYTDGMGFDDRQRHEMIGNSFSPVIINAIAEGIDSLHK